MSFWAIYIYNGIKSAINRKAETIGYVLNGKANLLSVIRDGEHQWCIPGYDSENKEIVITYTGETYICGRMVQLGKEN
jgi:hypothetical protein